MTKQPTFAAAILAGGKASRLNGIAKGNLKLKNGTTIIQHLIDGLLKVGCSEIIVVANDTAPYLAYGIKIVGDLQKELGPIGGIETALTYYLNKYDATVFLPCDLPAITALEIAQLKDAYLNTNAKVVYAKTKIAHPLCAVVNNSLSSEVSELIKNGERKIYNFWRQLGAKALSSENEQPFVNINTWADKRNFEFF